MLLRHHRLLNLPKLPASPIAPPLEAVSFHRPLSLSAQLTPSTGSPPPTSPPVKRSTSNVAATAASSLLRTALFVPPGVAREDVTEEMVLPGSNIVVGPYAGDAQIKQVEFVKSSARARDCPKDDRPEFAILGRSNVGKSSLVNALVRKKEFALTSKKPGKTQLINHFLVNKSWYIVDLPGYGFANVSQSARTDWSSFTKGYFLNRDTLVGVLLLVDASIPTQQIDLDCANWLGRNNIGLTFVFTKCDKMKNAKGKRPDENIKHFQDLISRYYKDPPPWIMTSSVTGPFLRPSAVTCSRSSSTFLEFEAGIPLLERMERKHHGGALGGSKDLEASASSVETNEFKVEKRKRFHQALLSLYHPPSPPQSPPPRSSQLTEDELVAIACKDIELNLDHGDKSNDGSDADDAEPRKLSRAQRKRLRKRKLKEHASSVRRKIIGPLLLSSDHDQEEPSKNVA